MPSSDESTRYKDHAPMRNGLERDSHDGCDICREQREQLEYVTRQQWLARQSRPIEWLRETPDGLEIWDRE